MSTATNNGNLADTSWESRKHRAELQLEVMLLESQNNLLAGLLDPTDEMFDAATGLWWEPMGSGYGGTGGAGFYDPFENELGLANARKQCRWLACHSEYAINAIENRINYTVGKGLKYTAVAKTGQTVSDEELERVKDFLEVFRSVNKMDIREKETVRRADRDGEAILRRFRQSDGFTIIRWVQPDELARPQSQASNPRLEFGVENWPGDAERPLTYWIDQEPVDAADVYHVKMNVDETTKRGISTLWAIRTNLRRAGRLQNNMSKVAAFQASVAAVRSHENASAAGVAAFAERKASGTLPADPVTGEERKYQRLGGGAQIYDLAKGTKMEFPANAIDASKFVLVLDAELRAMASRLVMPEFMFTSNAANGNFASTLVAEGPAYKMFEGLQAIHVANSLEIHTDAIAHAAFMNVLPSDILSRVELKVTAPALATRDPLVQAQANQILHTNGVLSKTTWAGSAGLDFDQEQQNFLIEEELGLNEPTELPDPSNDVPDDDSNKA